LSPLIQHHRRPSQIFDSARLRDVGEGQALKGNKLDDVTGGASQFSREKEIHEVTEDASDSGSVRELSIADVDGLYIQSFWSACVGPNSTSSVSKAKSAKALNTSPVLSLQKHTAVLEASKDLRKPAPATVPALPATRGRGLTRTWTSTNVLDMNATVVHANMRTNSSHIYGRISRRAACVDAVAEPETNPREPAKIVQLEPDVALGVHLKKTNLAIPQKSILKIHVPNQRSTRETAGLGEKRGRAIDDEDDVSEPDRKRSRVEPGSQRSIRMLAGLLVYEYHVEDEDILGTYEQAAEDSEEEETATDVEEENATDVEEETATDVEEEKDVEDE
jgi:hypothetical protein